MVDGRDRAPALAAIGFHQIDDLDPGGALGGRAFHGVFLQSKLARGTRPRAIVHPAEPYQGCRPSRPYISLASSAGMISRPTLYSAGSVFTHSSASTGMVGMPPRVHCSTWPSSLSSQLTK